MFEVRLRVVKAGSGSYLGIAEGFPGVLVHAATAEACVSDLEDAFGRHLSSLQDLDATRLELDDLPTVRVVTLYLGARPQ